jgi:threonine synthase
VTTVENSWEKVREIVKSQVEEDLKAETNAWFGKKCSIRVV